MITTTNIKKDLKEIRYYYSRQELFDKATNNVGKNTILSKVNDYNEAICDASPRLYDIYVSLYLENNTQESLSEKLGYSVPYISKLNSDLIKFLFDYFKKRGESICN